MIVFYGLLMIGLGVLSLTTAGDWEEGEWVRPAKWGRRSELNPMISGPLLIGLGACFLLQSVFTGIQNANEAQAEQAAQAADAALSAAFDRLLPDLQARAEAQPGIILTLTPGERERAGISDEVEVYFGWCTIDDSYAPFYIIVQNWNGRDYQRGFPALTWGGCGGNPEDIRSYMNGGSTVWLAIREDSFDYEAVLEQTAVAPTVAFEQTQWAITQTARATVASTLTPGGD
jgi:hypothetical protein